VFILADLSMARNPQKTKEPGLYPMQGKTLDEISRAGKGPPHADMGGLQQRAGSILILHFTLTALLLLPDSYLLFD
jgi:hypothetical protein